MRHALTHSYTRKPFRFLAICCHSSVRVCVCVCLCWPLLQLVGHIAVGLLVSPPAALPPSPHTTTMIAACACACARRVNSIAADRHARRQTRNRTNLHLCLD